MREVIGRMLYHLAVAVEILLQGSSADRRSRHATGKRRSEQGPSVGLEAREQSTKGKKEFTVRRTPDDSMCESSYLHYNNAEKVQVLTVTWGGKFRSGKPEGRKQRGKMKIT